MKLYRVLLLTLSVIVLASCGGAEERKAVYLERAKASIDSGDLDKARIELKNVLQIDPKDGEAHYQLGKVFEQQKDYRKAYGHYLKAEELAPELLANHARLGRFYLLLMNDTDKAQEKIDIILSKEADNSDGLLLKAAVLLRSNKRDEAINLAKVIVAQDPAHADSVAFLATLYLTDKKANMAISVLDAGLNHQKNNEKLSKLLALALVTNKDYERAEVIFKDFLANNPDNIASYNNLAAFYVQIDNKAKAEEILRDSIKNDSDDEERILTLIKYINSTKGKEAAIEELKLFVASKSGIGKLRIALAELLIINNDKPAAIDVFKEAIKDFSEEVTGITARTVLASIYIAEKDFDAAAEIVEEALSISPNDPKVNFLRAKFAVRDKDFETAIISLRIVNKEMPENIEAYILLANVHQQEGDVEQARATLNSAFDNNKTNADALLTLAQVHLRSDIGQAEKIIDAHNNLKGMNYEGFSIKAAILNQNKKHAEAHEIANTLMEAFPDKANGYLQAIPYYGQKDDKQSAVLLLEKAYINVKENRKILLLLTTFQMDEKKYDVVKNRIKVELAAAPEDVQLKILLAKVYMVTNKLDSAEQLLIDTLSLKPGIEEPYLLLSQIYQNKKDTVAVKEILVRGKNAVKTSLKIPLRLASLYEVEGAYKKAINVYRDIHELNPENLIIINNLASMLSDHSSDKKDLELAQTLASKLKESNQPVFFDTIGWVYYKLGNYQEAINYLSKATEKMPDINIFNYHLGMAYKMAGDTVQAKLHLEKSLENSENFKQKSLAEAALKEL